MRNTAGSGSVSPPGQLKAFPDAERVRPKTPRSDGQGLRRRWKDDVLERIYEWDYRHGRVEVYNSRGYHLGEFDPNTGQELKGPKPGRRVEP